MKRAKAKMSAPELERLCLAELKRHDGFSDVSGVSVAHLIGNDRGNWTVRRITRSGDARRPVGEVWTCVGLPVVDELVRSWDLLL